MGAISARGHNRRSRKLGHLYGRLPHAAGGSDDEHDLALAYFCLPCEPGSRSRHQRHRCCLLGDHRARHGRHSTIVIDDAVLGITPEPASGEHERPVHPGAGLPFGDTVTYSFHDTSAILAIYQGKRRRNLPFHGSACQSEVKGVERGCFEPHQQLFRAMLRYRQVHKLGRASILGHRDGAHASPF
jgi:hypothetical protein